MSGRKFSAEKCIRLLIQEAERLDQRRLRARKSASMGQRVHEQCLAEDDDNEAFDEGRMMEVFKTMMSKASASRMDSSLFGKLSADARKAWSSLSAEDCSVLLESSLRIKHV